MGYYTEQEPAPGQSLLRRISNAVDYDPYSLAKAAGVEYQSIVDEWNIVEPRLLTPATHNPMWQELVNFIDQRIALMMAAKAELSRKITLDADNRREAILRVQR